MTDSTKEAQVNPDVEVFDMLGQRSLKPNQVFAYDDRQTVEESYEGTKVVKNYYKVGDAWFSDWNPQYDRKNPFKKYITDVVYPYAVLLDKLTEWGDAPYMKELCIDSLNTLMQVLRTPTVDLDVLKTTLDQLKKTLRDPHVLCDLVYDEEKKRTGAFVVKVEFPFSSLTTFEIPTPTYSCKNTFTKCCLQYKNKCFWKLVPVYKDGVLRKVYNAKICTECDVHVDAHASMCGKRCGCQKCERVKEGG
jgi:hypothetical protein